MSYEKYPYNIFNPNYMNPDYLQQLQMKRHYEQQKKIGDMVKAISDYCKAARDIEPEYQQEALAACLAEAMRQASIDQQRNRGGYR